MAGGNNKKKKKPAANPARGFATTSTVSKARVEKTEDPPASNGSTTASQPATGGATPVISQNGSLPSTNTANDHKDQKDLKDLSPEDLEARLEQSELQQIVETHSAKVRKDATRQVTRLETDKRLQRGQAEGLLSSAWLPEAITCRLQHLIDDTSSDVPSQQASKTDSESVILPRIWTLQSVLQELSITQHLIAQALRYVLSLPSVEENASVWGLSETLEWLASNASDQDLSEYDTHKISPQVNDDEEHGEVIAQRIKEAASATNGKQSTKTARKPQASIGPDDRSDVADVEVSDTDSELDPDEMLPKYLAYKLRLFEHDPNTVDGSPIASTRTPGQTKLLDRIAVMDSDPLFDKQAADFAWREQRVQAFRDRTERRKLGIDTAAPKTKKTTTSNQTSTAADEASQQAEALARDLLQGSDDDQEGGLFEGMFDGASAEQTIPLSVNSETNANVTTRSFDKIAGTSPRKLLEETCKSRDQGCRINVKMISATTYHGRYSVLIQWTKDQDVVRAPYLEGMQVQSTKRAYLLEMIGIAATGADQAEGLACTAAMFSIFSGSPKEEKASLRLPPSFRDLFNEFSVAKQEIADTQDRQVVKELRGVIDQHKAALEEEDTVITAAFKNRSKNNSGINTPNGMIDGPQPEKTTNADLQDLWKKKTETSAYQSMLHFRKELPMYQFREQALEVVRQNQVTILCGETGCGKSTQMPAFILEDQMSQGKACRIYCTEPRRISAVSLAQRVSEELGESKGAVGTWKSLVGYAIRLESQSVASTKLIYATVGIVLRMLESKSGLDDLTHLIIDEVHERSIDTDFLLIVLRSLMVKRPTLKVILMSATVDADRFSRYLGNAPVITVPGRTFPVRAMYLEDAIEMTGYTNEDNRSDRREAEEEDDTESDQAKASLDTKMLANYSKSTIKTLGGFDEYRIDYTLIMKLLDTVAMEPSLNDFSKAVLVFLPGIAEIRQLTDMLTGHPTFGRGWLVYPLHSTFSNDEQQAAFKVPPKGMRKIVLATNIAETGITIPDVTCVIDTGKHKEMRFDERRQLSRLIQSFISRANAKQRRGRAGRVQEGICFHLFTKQRHDQMMAEQQTPEMLRLSLQDLVIRVKICKLGEIESALSQALDPPSVKNIRRAIDALTEVGALTYGEELTALGQQIARLPLDAQLGKLTLLAATFGCLDFALTAAAIASSKSPFLAPMNAKKQADTVRLGFKRGDSDLLTAYNAYTTWRRICTSPGISEFEFCKKNFLSPQNLSNIEELKGQLLSSIADTGLVTLSPEDRTALSRIRSSRHQRSFVPTPATTNTNEANDTLISAVVAWSFYPKILVRDGKGWRSIGNNQSLSLHPTSVNKLSTTPAFEKSKYLSFYSIMQSSSRFTNAQETTPVEAMALVLLAGDARFDFYSGVIVIDGNRLRFKVRRWREMVLLKALRTKIRDILAKMWRKPGREMSGREKEWFDIFLEIFRGFDERRLKAKG